MPDRDKNTIQVQLDLLQNKNFELLKEFGDKFSNDVTRLIEQLKENYAAVTQTEPSVAGHNKAASVADVPPRFLYRSAYAVLPGHYGITEFERAQFGLGMLGQGALPALRYMSFLAGEGAKFDREGRPERETLGMISGITGALARGLTYAQAAYHMAQRAPILQWFDPQMTTSLAQYGVNIGKYAGGEEWYSLGTAYFSPAWWAGLRAKWEAAERSSRFGGPGFWGGAGTVANLTLGRVPILNLLFGNPNYSPAQSEQALQLTNAAGWTGTQQDIALDMMRRYTERYRGVITQEQIMQLIDPALRFGTTSRSQVEQAIDGMAEAARAANMSLTQFAATAISAAEGLAKSSGMTQTQALEAINAYTTVTGRSPEEAAQALGNEKFKGLAIAMTGRPYEAVYGKYAGINTFEASLAIIPPYLKDPETWKQLYQPGNERQLAQVRDVLTWYAEKDMLGGMTVPEFENLMRRQVATGIDPIQAMKATRDIDEAKNRIGIQSGVLRGAGQRGLEQFDAAIRLVDLGPEVIESKIEDLEKNEENLTYEEKEELRIARFLKRKIKDGFTRKEEKELADRIISGQWKRAGENAAEAGQYMITVKPPYNQIFDIIMKGGNKSRINQKQEHSRSSSGEWKWDWRQAGASIYNAVEDAVEGLFR